MVSLATNRSSVPYRFIGQRVEVQRRGDTVHIVHRDQEIATHPVLHGQHQFRIQPEHGAALNAAQLERLRDQLTRLRLLKSRERLEALLQEAAAQERPSVDVLDQVLGEEVASKAAKNMAMRTSLARFPFVKSLEVFDFSSQPSLDKKQLQQVATCHFIEHGEHVVSLGPPGVGKSHLAIGLGLHAIERGYRILFTTAAAMIATLTRALTEHRLEDKLKLHTIPRLLIIDEIGYLPIDRTGANLFFQLISCRYEKGPMILTSNQSFGAWGGSLWRPGARDRDSGSGVVPRDHH